MTRLRIDRTEKYAVGGTLLAETARDLHLPISDNTEDDWNQTMRRLAHADDLSEVDQNLSIETAMRVLGLDSAHEALRCTVEKLIAANYESRTAPTIPRHFAARGQEAFESFELLRLQSDLQDQQPHTWRQLSLLCQMAIYLDSLVDCKEDARELHFSAFELARGSLVAMRKVRRQIEPVTFIAQFSAICKHSDKGRIFVKSKI